MAGRIRSYRSNCCTGCTVTNTLCITARTCSGFGFAFVKASVRFQGPGGIDTTMTAGSADGKACYSNPPAGTWTITVSHGCFTTQTFTITISGTLSNAATVTLVSRWYGWSYSDDYGSTSRGALSGCSGFTPSGCGAGGEYLYTSSDGALYSGCPPKADYLAHQAAPACVMISVRWTWDAVADSGTITVERYTVFAPALVLCSDASPSGYWPASGGSSVVLAGSATFTPTPCGPVSVTFSLSGTAPPPGIYGTYEWGENPVTATFTTP